MITPFVMRAFDRLAAAAIMDIARSATPDPDPSHVDRFMEEAFKLDGNMGSAFEDAKRDDAAAVRSGDEPTREEMFREVFEQMLESIAHGGTQSAKAVSDGDITRLMNTIRMVLEKTIKGEGRKRKSVGIRARLWDFGEALSKSETRDSAAREIAEFVQEAFSGEMDRLVRSYWWSRSRLTGGLKSVLLTQETGSRAKAEEQARLHVFRMLLEGVHQAIKTKSYAQKPNDAAALGAIAQGVWHRIRNRETGDQYDGETAATSGGKYARWKWGKYIVPLQDTGKFGDRESLDTLGITRFLNEHFLRRDLDSRTPVEVPLPGGGTMTAPSFRTELKHADVRMWAATGLPPASLDAPLPDGGTLSEAIGGQDRPRGETEEGVVEWLGSPAETDPAKTNRDVVRGKLRSWVDKAIARTEFESPNINREPVKDIMLVKLGFMSGASRAEFIEKWLDKDIPKFRAEVMSDDEWADLGKPLRKGHPKEGYRSTWTQNALVNRYTGEELSSMYNLRENPDDWKIVPKEHKKGDPPNTTHFLNWIKYGQEDRRRDLERALDVYSDRWFELSVNEGLRKELRKKERKLSEAFDRFDPKVIFTPVATRSDQELIRAMGYVKPSVQPLTGKTLFQQYSRIQPDMRRAIRELGGILKEESEDDSSVLQYLGLKALGKVASRTSCWDVVSAAVDDLMEAA